MQPSQIFFKNWSLHVFGFMSSLIKLLLTTGSSLSNRYINVSVQKNESYLHTTVYAFIDRCTKNIFSLKMHFYDYFSTLLYTQYMVFKIRFSGKAFKIRRAKKFRDGFIIATLNCHRNSWWLDRLCQIWIRRNHRSLDWNFMKNLLKIFWQSV